MAGAAGKKDVSLYRTHGGRGVSPRGRWPVGPEFHASTHSRVETAAVTREPAVSRNVIPRQGQRHPLPFSYRGTDYALRLYGVGPRPAPLPRRGLPRLLVSAAWSRCNRAAGAQSFTQVETRHAWRTGCVT
eukprot:2411750-Prymnesium_polylepis.1